MVSHAPMVVFLSPNLKVDKCLGLSKDSESTFSVIWSITFPVLLPTICTDRLFPDSQLASLPKSVILLSIDLLHHQQYIL